MVEGTKFLLVLLQKVVHKKYTHKDGKSYGPYLYETKRVDGKVVTSYLGSNPVKKRSLTLFILVSFLLILGMAFVTFKLFSTNPATGMVALDVSLVYKEGEKLDGDLKFRLKEGELVPRDSNVVISYADQSKTFALSDLILDSTSEGSYYAEGISLSGQGEGYGIKGTKFHYPEIEFTLEVTRASSSSDSSENSEPTSETVSEDVSESSDSVDETEPSEEEPSSESESSEESSGESSGEPGITGNVVSEESYTVSGSVSRDADFEFDLADGESARIISDSVTIDGEPASSNTLDLDQNGNEVTVSTDYFVSEEGFGEEFIGDYALILEVPIDRLDLTAVPGTINVELVYNSISLATLTKDVNVVQSEETPAETILAINPITLLKDIPTIRIAPGEEARINLADYFSGAESYRVSASDIDASLESTTLVLRPIEGFKGSRQVTITAVNGESILDSNSFLVLVSSGAVSITTTRSKIVVGEPVQWVKTVSLDAPEALAVELPTDATNVVITDTQSGEVIESDSSLGSSLISGNVVIELDLEKDSSLTSWLKEMWASVTSVTGFAIDESPEETVNLDLPGESTDYTIEYTTPAPISEEKVLGVSNKEVTISAADDLHYSDVIAFTSIPNERHVKDASRIGLKWVLPTDVFVSDSVESIKEVDDVAESVVIGASSESSEVSSSAGITGNAISVEVIEASEESIPFDQITKEEISYSVVIDKASVPFDAYDLDEDGNIDYIEWVVPHLSDQTYEVLIAGAQHLDSESNFISDVTSEVLDQDAILAGEISVGERLYLDFTEALTNTSILRIWTSYDTKNGQSSVKIYNPYTVELINSGYLDADAYTDFDLSALAGDTTDALDIEVTDEAGAGVSLIVDQAVGNSTILSDTTPPSVSFVSPTPSDGSTQSATSIPVNFTASDASSQYAFLNFNRDLRLWLTMDNANSTGGFVDRSGWGNNATAFNGAVAIANGPYNSSLRLNGTRGMKPYASVTNNPSLRLNLSGITVSAWINRSSTACYYHLSSSDNGTDTSCAILTMTYPGAQQGWEFYATGSNLQVLFRNGGAVANTQTAGGISNGVWTHVAFTFNGSVIKHYINGANVKNTTATTWADTTIEPLGIGVRSPINNPYLGNPFNGSIDEVLVFNRSLEPGEMAALYTASSRTVYRNYTGLSSGVTYNFTAYSSDAYGNRNSVSRGVTIGTADATAPVVNLRAPTNGSSSTSTSRSFNATFTDDTALSNVTFYLWNSTGVAINTTTVSASGTSASVNLTVTLPYNGNFFWNYLARDSSSNSAFNRTNYTVIFDNIAPNYTIISPLNTTYNSSTVRINVTSSDASGSITTLYYLDSSEIGSFYTVPALEVLTQGSHLINFTFTDGNGNVNRTSLYFSVDSIFPTISFVSPTPANATYLSSNSFTVNISGNESSIGSGIVTLDSTPYTMTCTGNPIYACNRTFTGLSQGSHTYFASVNDTTGKTNSTQTRTVYIDSAAPSVALLAPRNNTAVSVASVTFNATLSDSVSLANVTFYLWNSTHAAVNITSIGLSGTSASVNLSVVLPYNGLFRWNYLVRDNSSNQAFNNSNYTITYDSVRPLVQITAPSNLTYTSPISTLAYTASDTNLATCWYSLDNGLTNATGTCGISLDVSSSEGSNTWIVAANDTAGNLNMSRVSFSVDTIRPSINFTVPTTANNSRLTNRTLIVNVSATDTAFANITVRIYNSSGLFNLTTSTSSPYYLNFTSLPDGTYTFNASASDTAGNTNSTPTRIVYYDATAPGVSISNPTNSTWTFSSINIAVVLTENGSAQYTLNGGATNYTLSTTNNINFNATNNSIGDGQYTIRIYANDTFGNTNHTVTNVFTIDNTPPVLNITSPLNTTYTSNPILVEYTAVDASGTILQMEYNTGEGYVSYTGPVNVTVSQGSHTFDFAGVDDSDNTNITSVTFFLDSLTPTIAFTSPTPANGTSQNTSSLTVNVTGNETNLNGAILTVNATNYTMTCTGSGIYSCNYTLNGLSEGTYSYRVTVNDTVGHLNSTDWRTITIDSQRPLIAYATGTENEGEIVGDAIVPIVLNITESNVANVTFSLYNSSGLVDRTVSSGLDQDYNFSSVSDGVYTYFASVSDNVGNSNITSNRSIRVISSCLNQCTEGASCTVTGSCMLHSGLCTGSVCDFTNLTLNNATIYTLYESSAGRPLVLNISSNSTSALRFLLNSSFRFSGKNGSTLGSGSLGGNGGILNITVSGLFNRTSAQFYSSGGYSTLSGTGGNGGNLQVTYHGLIGTTSAWTTSFSAGSSLSSSSGSAGSSVLVKDSVCPLDADLSNDGSIGITDVARVTSRYGNVTGDSTYDSTRDIDCNGEINVIDLTKVGFDYGR